MIGGLDAQNPIVRKQLTRKESVFIPMIDSRYQIISEIGHGGYSIVYKAIEISSRNEIALKKIQVFDKHLGLPTSFYRELKCLQQMAGIPNIVQLKNVIRSKSEGCFYFSLEYCEYNLFSVLHTITLTRQQIQSYFKQILLAVQHMHSLGYIHCDLKPSNILLTKDNQIKLCDFGMTSKCDDSYNKISNNIATPSYRPPEILLGDTKISPSIDIWGLGCILYEMVTQKKLFNPIDSSDISQLFAIFQICGTPTELTWPKFDLLPNSVSIRSFPIIQSNLHQILEISLPTEFSFLIDLLENMLQLDPSKRLKLETILSHPFFTDDIKLPQLHLMESHTKDSIPKVSPFIKKVERFMRPERVLPPPILA